MNGKPTTTGKSVSKPSQPVTPRISTSISASTKTSKQPPQVSSVKRDTASKPVERAKAKQSPSKPIESRKRPRIEDEAEELAENFTVEEAEEMERGQEPEDEEQTLTQKQEASESEDKELLVLMDEGAKTFIQSSASAIVDLMEVLELDLDSDVANKTVAKMLVHVLNGLYKLKQNPAAALKTSKHASQWNTRKVMNYLAELTQEGSMMDE